MAKGEKERLTSEKGTMAGSRGIVWQERKALGSNKAGKKGDKGVGIFLTSSPVWGGNERGGGRNGDSKDDSAGRLTKG